MYIPLERNLKKSYFKELLEIAIELTQKKIEATPSLSVCQSILNQLNDIKQNVVEKNIVFSEEEARKDIVWGK
ncbi:hypothetical protein [Capnocytophaga sp.]|uniref:hypothetical protein n=1 Tax=Capnocytophaga sp. TaxID=44737 RepID=UPI0026DBC67F|nr:hypothetical protein [Capnocytophaga sp.]MDO5106149.1 hypothetical protein [Capnocytophaga sp.]